MADTSQMSEIEQTVYEEFDQMWNRQHPEPRVDQVRLLTTLGLDFWISVFQAVAAVIFNSMRTGSAFFIAASHIGGNDSSAIAWIEAISGVIAYDFFLLGTGISDGQKNRRLTGWLKAISIAFIWLTITVAGFWVASDIGKFGFTDSIAVFLGVTIAFASIPLLVSGELLGQSYAEAKDLIVKSTALAKREWRAWKQDKDKEWHDRKAILIRRYMREKHISFNTPAQSEDNMTVQANGNGNGHSNGNGNGNGNIALAPLVQRYIRQNHIDVSQKIDYELMQRVIAQATGITPRLDTLRKIVQRMRERSQQIQKN